MSEDNIILTLEDQKRLQNKKSGPKTHEQRRRAGLPSRGSKRVAGRKKTDTWTQKEKTHAACVFAVTGNSRRVEEITGIPEATIRYWKTQEWWHEIQARIIQEADEELDTRLTDTVNKAVREVNDRLENGDFVYNVHKDKLVRKPIGGKDLTSITASMLDKRQLLRGQPTSRVEKVSADERLKKLANQFKQFTRTIEYDDTGDIQITEEEV